MKKTLLIITTVAAIALLLFFYQKSLEEKSAPGKAGEVEPDKLSDEEKEKVTKVALGEGLLSESIPDGGVFYANFIDLKSTHKIVEQTNFFKEFIALKVFADFKKDIEKFNKKSTFDISFENILKIIGNDIYFSIYMDPEVKGTEVLISTQVDDAVSYIAKVLNFLIQSAQAENKDTEVGKETYSDIDINYIRNKTDKESLYYIIMDNNAHISNNISLIKNAIDLVQDNKQNSLKLSKRYNKARNNFRDKHFFSMYYAIDSLKNIDALTATKPAGKANNLDQLIYYAENYDYMYMDAIVKDGIDILAGANLKEDARKDYLEALSTTHGMAGKSEYSGNVKASPLFFASYNAISFEKYYADMKKQEEMASGITTIASIEQSFTNFTKLSLSDDVIPLFSDEMFYLGTTIDSESSPLMPIPNIFIGIKLKDVASFENVFNTVNNRILEQKNGMPLKVEEYNGARVAYMITPFGLIPGHAITNNYYIMFSTLKGFQELIDNTQTDKVSYFGEKSNPDIKKYVYDDYHYFSYFDVRAFIQQIPDLYDKYSATLQSSQSNEKRRETLKEYNEKVLPLIQTLHAFNKIYSSGYYDKEKNGFVFKSQFTMNDIE
ncbi:hypothetical protein ACFL2A_00295 [Thermodesulfobacteriota bacterium]